MTESTRDLLMSRIVDGDADDRTWQQLAAQAEGDPSVWRELGEMLREHAVIAGQINHAASVAEAVEAPVELLLAARTAVDEEDTVVPEVHVLPMVRFGAWSGWAVAALVALAFVMRFTLPERPVDPGVQSAGLLPTGAIPVSSAEEAYQAYLDKGIESGTVIREMPQRVLIDSHPAADGKGYELLYLRQILEKTYVPDLYQINGQDERGQPTLVRYDQPAGRRM